VSPQINNSCLLFEQNVRKLKHECGRFDVF
jgi:hypothetical protein